MAKGLFKVQELPKKGLFHSSLNLGSGEHFEWTADREAEDPVAGGARSTPHGTLNIGGSLRRVRTDYPGALLPSEQILGPTQKDQAFEGVWDDRYNFRGFAVALMRRFEAMCRRGNPVRVSFQRQVFEGIIFDWDFPYKGDWLVGYKFVLSVHNRVDDGAVVASTTSLPASISGLTRIQPTVPSVSEAAADTDLMTVAALDVHQKAPRARLVEGLADGMDQVLGALVTARDEALRTIDGRPQRPELVPLDKFRRLASQLRQIKSTAVDLVYTLGDVRSDLSMDAQAAIDVLDFEDWSRGLRFAARGVMGTSSFAAASVEQKVKPRAVRLYRPHQGESLYSISRREYGTPHAWSLIAERNNLKTFNLTGEEVLIIPERGTV